MEYLMVWAKYMSPCDSIAGPYTLRVLMTSYQLPWQPQGPKPKKRPLNFSFSKLSEKLIW